MTDPKHTSPVVMQGWESLKQRTLTLVVIALLVVSTLVTPAGRQRMAAWTSLAMESLTPDQKNLSYSPPLPDLTVEQRRVARWIANRHRVSVSAVEQLVVASYTTAISFRLDPYLLLALISIESGFNPYAESAAGAVGLMQIMPKVHAEKFRAFGGLASAIDPWVNMQVGAQILREYLDRFGSEYDALRAYVGARPETLTSYPDRVMRERERLLAAAVGRALA